MEMEETDEKIYHLKKKKKALLQDKLKLATKHSMLV